MKSSRRADRALVDDNRTPGSNLRTALGLAPGSAVAIGLARFAYALLLPSMRSNLHWSFALAGAMNTANALGYLIGALLTAVLIRRFGSRQVFIASLGVTVVTLVLTGASSNTLVLVALRATAGMSGAITFIAGAGLVVMASSNTSSRQSTKLLGIYFAGGGAAIIATGLVIPYLLSVTTSADGWRWGWALLAGLGTVSFVISTRTALACADPPKPPAGQRRWPVGRLGPILLSYALFGAGYIAYMTFIVAFLKDHGMGPGGVTAFWVVLGASSIIGAFAWARPISRLRGGFGLVMILSVISIGAMLPLLSRSSVASLGSAVVFGGSFLSTITAVTAVSRRALEPHHWTPAIAGLTVAFALGQCLGPILAGVLSDGPAGLSVGLTLSVAVLLLATVVASTQKHYERPGHSRLIATDQSDPT